MNDPANILAGQGKKKVLFCRSGGGMSGLDVHMGIWLALEECGIRSTSCSGTSAGAIISACDATGNGPQGFKKKLMALSDEDIRQERFLWKLRAPWVDWFLGDRPVRRALAELFPAQMHSLAKELFVWATREEDGSAWCLQRRDISLIDQVLASAAIPGVFPKVELPGMHGAFSDGGTTNYCALVPGWKEYDEVWLLVATPSFEYKPKRESMISRFILAAQLMMHRQIYEQLAEVMKQGQTRGRWPAVRVIRPACGRDSGMLRFNHDLIGKAYSETITMILREKDTK